MSQCPKWFALAIAANRKANNRQVLADRQREVEEMRAKLGQEKLHPVQLRAQYNQLLKAFAANAKWKDAESIFKEMRSQRVRPNEQTFTHMVWTRCEICDRKHETTKNKSF